MEWITTSDVGGESWRRILEYANIDFTLSKIIKDLGQSYDKGQNANYRKQAKQIRVAILQSKEYFDAAEKASLYTSPNQLFYGMVSLSSAIMLMRGSGEQSLDRLRKDRRNRQHGLDFSTSATAATSALGITIINSTFATVLERGHFINWYSTLPSIYDIYATEQVIEGDLSRIERKSVGKERAAKASSLANRRFSLLDLIKNMPDLIQHLQRFDIRVPFSRVNIEKIIDRNSKTVMYRWRIHGARAVSDLEKILDQFRSPASYSDSWGCSEFSGRDSCVVTFTIKAESVEILFPSIRENINNDHLCYSTELDTHEIGDAYIIAYALSMLARYYPDYWIACLESHCGAANIIEQLIFILLKKYPIMALRHLAQEDIVISPHLPRWHD